MTSDELWVAAHLEALAAADSRYANLGPSGSVEPPPSRPPCAYEEGVREFCHTCRGEKAEGRHVRGCAIHEVCTREKNSSKIVKSCAACAEYCVGGGESPPPTQQQ